jgi:hypothetical protein
VAVGSVIRDSFRDRAVVSIACRTSSTNAST